MENENKFSEEFISDSENGSRFIFTIFNYTQNDIDHLKSLDDDEKKTEGVWFGEEKCPTTGRDHIQGYLETPAKARPEAVCKMLHYEYEAYKVLVAASPTGKNKLKLKDFAVRISFVRPAKAKRISCIYYCFKGEQPKEEYNSLGIQGPNYGKNAKTFGTMPEKNNEAVRDEYKLAIEAIKENPDVNNFMMQFPKMYIKHFFAINNIIDKFAYEKNHQRWIEINKHTTLRPWQQSVLEEVIIPIEWLDPRANEVLWIYDPEGLGGKSTLGTHLEMLHNALVFPGEIKPADALNTYKGETIIVFDIERACYDKFNFSILETFMRPRIYSGKYNGKHIERPAGRGGRIIVFSNDLPIKSKLSSARWDVRKLVNGTLTKFTNFGQLAIKNLQ